MTTINVLLVVIAVLLIALVVQSFFVNSLNKLLSKTTSLKGLKFRVRIDEGLGDTSLCPSSTCLRIMEKTVVGLEVLDERFDPYGISTLYDLKIEGYGETEDGEEIPAEVVARTYFKSTNVDEGYKVELVIEPVRGRSGRVCLTIKDTISGHESLLFLVIGRI